MPIGARSFSNLFPAASNPDVESYIEEQHAAVVRPRGAEGIYGWVFDIPTGERIENRSDITDHFTENNSFINDHVVQKPQRVTLSGYVGELVFKLSEASAQSKLLGEGDGARFPGNIQELQNLLEQVDVYAGEFTPGMVQTAQRALNLAYLYQSTLNRQIAKAQNLVGVFNGSIGVPVLPPIPGADPGSTIRQKQMYEQLEGLRRSNQIVTVQTPWQYFESMMIESLSISQDENTSTWSEVRVTLKEIRFSDLRTTTFDQDLFPPRVDVQSEETVDAGRVQTVPDQELTSTLYRVFVGE